MKKQIKNKKNFKDILKTIGSFFNKPLPIIIVLSCICIYLLVFIYRNNTVNKIIVGSVSTEDVQVQNIHYFANNDMNYFYAINAHSERKEKVYAYQVGYYTVDNKKNYTEFAARSGKLTTPLAVSDIIGDYSGWNIAELANNPVHFTNANKNNIDELHFVFKGSTKKDSTDSDIVIDVKVDIQKITK